MKHYYNIPGFENKFNESEFLIINYDNFPNLAFDNRIIIDLIEDGSAIEIRLFGSGNAHLIE